MLNHLVRVAPDKAPAADTRIDRTQILDPKDYWRDPATCPDWPVMGPNHRYEGPRGKVGAEARLEAIGRFLNRGPGTLRVPTEDEREQQFSATFRRSGSAYYAIGIDNLSPLGRLVEAEAELIAEACHLRGYLRKLEIKAQAEVDQVQVRKNYEAQRTLEEYRRNAPAQIAEIEALAEAVARHKQREEDERAVSRTYALRQTLTQTHSAAVRAAHALDLGVPDAPEHLL